MYKILASIIVLVFHSSAHCLSCNYNILKSNVDTYLYEIIKQIPDNINERQIKQDLIFVSHSGEDNVLQKYSSENFKTLYDRSIELISRYNGVSKTFIELCEQVHTASSSRPDIQLAVHMLLYEVTEELSKHAANVDAMKSVMAPHSS